MEKMLIAHFKVYSIRKGKRLALAELWTLDTAQEKIF